MPVFEIVEERGLLHVIDFYLYLHWRKRIMGTTLTLICIGILWLIGAMWAWDGCPKLKDWK